MWTPTEYSTKTFSPYLLLLDIKANLSTDDKIELASLDKATQSNIDFIIKKCNASYHNAAYRGHDALNRAILLDPEIALHLTADTLIALFKLQDEDIKLKRNTTFKPTFAGVLEYGFKQGLDVIKYIPNNPPVQTLFGQDIDTLGAAQKGVANFEKQQIDFEKNTLMIVDALKSASELCGLKPNEPKYQMLTKSNSPAVLFARINKVIQTIKVNGERGNLLENAANSSISALRNECSSCVRKLIIMTGVNKNNTDISLDEFVKKCFEDPNYMLNDRITHSFYDRLHLEARIEEDAEEYAIINERIYSISQILEEMVKQSENPEVSPLIKIQFTIRLQQVMDHLLDIKANGKLHGDYPDYNDILLGKVEFPAAKKHENQALLEDWRIKMLQYKEQGDFTQLREEIKKINTNDDPDQLVTVKGDFINKCLAYEKVEIILVEETPPEKEKGFFDNWINFFTMTKNLSFGEDTDLIQPEKKANNTNNK